MPYDFIKITDVDLMEEANEGTNVIVEDDGDLKRVPAFILNKPTKMGGYTYYYYYNYYLYKCDDHTFNRGDTPVTQTEFEADYYSCPILLNNGYSISPVVSYNNVDSKVHFADGNVNVDWNT